VAQPPKHLERHHVSLDAQTIDAIAEALLDKLLARLDGEELHHDPPRRRYVDAAELADELGMSRDWVYDNSKLLGAERRGTGPKSRLRFDLDRARAAAAASTRAESKPRARTSRRARRRPGMTRNGVPLLPVRGLTLPHNGGTVASDQTSGPAAPERPGPWHRNGGSDATAEYPGEG
jgi:hypothetical protein